MGEGVGLADGTFDGEKVGDVVGLGTNHATHRQSALLYRDIPTAGLTNKEHDGAARASKLGYTAMSVSGLDRRSERMCMAQCCKQAAR